MNELAPDDENATPGANLRSSSERTSQLPALFVDVDGVISLFGFEQAYGLAPGDAPFQGRPDGALHSINGIHHYIRASAGRHLVELASYFELVWATGWEETANEHLPYILELERDLPYLRFDGRVTAGPCHWKIEAITEYAGDERPLAWIDDNLDATCFSWARERPAPTLLIETRRHVGMTDDHVEDLTAFARTLGAPGLRV